MELGKRPMGARRMGDEGMDDIMPVIPSLCAPIVLICNVGDQ